ncbi:hypothetical protein [Pacificibacter sp. AS14]
MTNIKAFMDLGAEVSIEGRTHVPVTGGVALTLEDILILVK